MLKILPISYMNSVLGSEGSLYIDYFDIFLSTSKECFICFKSNLIGFFSRYVVKYLILLFIIALKYFMESI